MTDDIHWTNIVWTINPKTGAVRSYSLLELAEAFFNKFGGDELQHQIDLHCDIYHGTDLTG